MGKHYNSISSLVANGRTELAKGPIGIIIAEDEVELDSTLRHHLGLGFASIILACPPRANVPTALQEQIIRVDCDTVAENAACSIVNPIIKAAAGQWLYYCYNAEYLFYPFCENRTVAELLTFHTEERRAAMRGVVLDLYPGDLTGHPDGTAVEDAWFDGAPYYSNQYEGAPAANDARHNALHGGLRWRFEEEIPSHRRRLDRVPIFKARPDLELTPDHRTTGEEENTIACEWHHNLTATIASFRCAKALVSNTAVSNEITQFAYSGSVAFEWHSQQLMDLGFMEPGQWF